MARKTEDRIIVALRAENEELERKLRQSQESLKKYADTAEKSNTRAATSFDYSTRATRTAAKGFDNVSYRVTNFSRQMQDATVQLQSGTDAFTVIAQQGSQLFEGFGRTGPIIGGIVALAAALGGTLWKALNSASEEADDLREKIESVYSSTATAQLIAANAAIKQQEEDLKSLQGELYAASQEVMRLTDAAAKMTGLSESFTRGRLQDAREEYGELADAIEKAKVTLEELVKTRDKLEGKDVESSRAYYAELWKLEKEGQEFINELIQETLDERADIEKAAGEARLKAEKARAQEWQDQQVAYAMVDKMVEDALQGSREYWAEQRKLDTEGFAFIDELVQKSLDDRRAYFKELNDLVLEYDPVAREMALHEAKMAMLQDAHADVEAEERRHQLALGEARVEAFEAQGEYIDALLEDYQNQSTNAAAVFEGVMADSLGSLIEGTSDAFAQMIVQGEDMRKIMESIGKTILTSVISAITQMLLQEAALHFFKISATKKELAAELAADKTRQTAAAASLVVSTAAAKVSGAAIAAAYAPAAAMASLASFGANSAPAMAGITATTTLAMTQATLTGMAHDGIDSVPREGTWLLDKGERVFSADQNERITRAMETGGTSLPTDALPVVVSLLERIANTQPIVFNGPGWDMNQIFERFKSFIDSGDRVLISRKSRNGKELAA